MFDELDDLLEDIPVNKNTSKQPAKPASSNNNAKTSTATKKKDDDDFASWD